MGWIIAGAVVVVIMILLMTSVKVRFEYSDGLRLRINCLFITLVQIPAGTRKRKRRNAFCAQSPRAARRSLKRSCWRFSSGRMGRSKDETCFP